MAAKDKDTIYIDVDDEITGIIDKVRGSDGKVVALVLPKRAAVLQSIVNMKLLKRAADSVSKHLVLITTEAGLLPLAGAAGVHVAKTLTSKPAIPAGPDLVDEAADEPIPEEEVAPDGGVPLEPDKTLGELAAAGEAAGIASPPPPSDEVETVVLDDEDLPPEAADEPSGKSFAPPAKTKDKKLKIPDFDRFRLLLIGGALLIILLIFFFVFANSVLPKATIKINTDAANIDYNMDLNLDTGAKSLDPSSNTLPSKVDQVQKSYNQTVPTTGQTNKGNKATGSVTITNCDSSDITLPAGTGVTSGGNTYITQDDVTVPDSNFTSPGSGSQCKKDGKASVQVIAQNGGSSYNMPSGASFNVAGYSSSVVYGQGGSISGGTDNIVQTVNQNDINSAKSKISASDSDIKQSLKDQLGKDGYYALTATYAAAAPNVTNSANVGDVATSVTVTENVTYTMFGVHKNDLESLIKNAISAQIDTSKQGILDNGLGQANFNVNNLAADKAQLTMSSTAEVGPDLNIDSIKQQAAGKKPGAVKDQLSTNPDVTSVDVKLSPFWVSSVPKNTSKIKVEIAKPQAHKPSSNASNP